MTWKGKAGVGAIIAFIGWLVVTKPAVAAGAWNAILAGVGNVANGLANFISNIT